MVKPQTFNLLNRVQVPADSLSSDRSSKEERYPDKIEAGISKFPGRMIEYGAMLKLGSWENCTLSFPDRTRIAPLQINFVCNKGNLPNMSKSDLVSCFLGLESIKWSSGSL